MKIQLPTLIALVVVLMALAAVYLFGPALGVDPAAHESLTAAVGSLGAVLLAVMRGLLGHDEDGDGIPDILDREDGRKL